VLDATGSSDPQPEMRLRQLTAAVVLPTQPPGRNTRARSKPGLSSSKQCAAGAHVHLARRRKTCFWPSGAQCGRHPDPRNRTPAGERAVPCGASPRCRHCPIRCFQLVEARRKGIATGHVEFDKAYYSVPPEYLGREVWVRGESRSCASSIIGRRRLPRTPAPNPAGLPRLTRTSTPTRKAASSAAPITGWIAAG